MGFGGGGRGDERDVLFTGIVERYYERILKYCCYVLGSDRGLAEDCTQDIFLILYEKMGELKDYEKIGGWLYKTAGHISKRYAAFLRRERARFAVSAAGFGAVEDEGSLLDGIADKKPITSEEERLAEEKMIAWAAGEITKRLKGDDERIVELVFREKRPLKEAAGRLGLSLSAMKSRVSRLRQKIGKLARELLADDRF